MQDTTSKVKGEEFDLTLDYLVENFTNVTHCSFFGSLLDWKSRGSSNDNSPSLDAILPELGHMRGNVQVISHLANRMKSDANLEELLNFSKGAGKMVAAQTQKIAQFYRNPLSNQLSKTVLDIALCYLVDWSVMPKCPGR